MPVKRSAVWWREYRAKRRREGRPIVRTQPIGKHVDATPTHADFEPFRDAIVRLVIDRGPWDVRILDVRETTLIVRPVQLRKSSRETKWRSASVTFRMGLDIIESFTVLEDAPASNPPIPPAESGDACSDDAQLFVDLVPSTSWGVNARTIGRARWRRISNVVRALVDACEICGRHETLDIHERWHFDEAAGTQTLVRLIALCRLCHLATHMGRAAQIGYGVEARERLASVRGWDEAAVREHITEAMETWRRRSSRTWVVNIDLLDQYDPPRKRGAQPPTVVRPVEHDETRTA